MVVITQLGCRSIVVSSTKVIGWVLRLKHPLPHVTCGQFGSQTAAYVNLMVTFLLDFFSFLLINLELSDLALVKLFDLRLPPEFSHLTLLLLYHTVVASVNLDILQPLHLLFLPLELLVEHVFQLLLLALDVGVLLREDKLPTFLHSLLSKVVIVVRIACGARTTDLCLISKVVCLSGIVADHHSSLNLSRWEATLRDTWHTGVLWLVRWPQDAFFLWQRKIPKFVDSLRGEYYYLLDRWLPVPLDAPPSVLRKHVLKDEIDQVLACLLCLMLPSRGILLGNIFLHECIDWPADSNRIVRERTVCTLTEGRAFWGRRRKLCRLRGRHRWACL